MCFVSGGLCSACVVEFAIRVFGVWFWCASLVCFCCDLVLFVFVFTLVALLLLLCCSQVDFGFGLRVSFSVGLV